MSTETPWLTRKQVAALTGFAPKTLANWASAIPPKGPRFVRVGGESRYDAADVAKWRASYTKTAA